MLRYSCLENAVVHNAIAEYQAGFVLIPEFFMNAFFSAVEA